MAYATINPYTGETVAKFPDATDAEVRTALDKADAAFQKWRGTSFAERGRILQNAANILRRDSEAFAKLLTLWKWASSLPKRRRKWNCPRRSSSTTYATRKNC